MTRDTSTWTTHRAILKPSDLVLGVPPIVISSQKMGGVCGGENGGVCSPFRTRVLRVPCFLASSLLLLSSMYWIICPQANTWYTENQSQMCGGTLKPCSKNNRVWTWKRICSFLKPVKQFSTFKVDHWKGNRVHILILGCSSGTALEKNSWFLRFKHRFVLKAQEEQTSPFHSSRFTCVCTHRLCFSTAGNWKGQQGDNSKGASH